MQALVRIQAYMLADIVVAISAVDVAVEAVVSGRWRECSCVLPCIRSLSQLAAVYPPKTHVVLGAHVCPFPIRICDITLPLVIVHMYTIVVHVYVRTYL